MLLMPQLVVEASPEAMLPVPDQSREMKALGNSLDIPLVILLCQHQAHQPARCRPVRQYIRHVRPSAYLMAWPFQRVVRPDLPPVRFENVKGIVIRTGHRVCLSVWCP